MKKSPKFKISDKIVVYFLQFWLIIDMANGFMINGGFYLHGALSLGEVTRFLFLLLLLFSLRIGKSKNDFLFIVVPYLLIVLSFIQYLLLDINLVRNLSISTKLSLPLLLYIFIKNNLYNRYLILIKIIYINSIVLILNLYLTYFGIGFSNYRSGTAGIEIGGTGFFYAANEVAGVLLTTYAIILYNVRYSSLKALAVTTIFFIGSLALLGKSSIFGIALLYVVYLIAYNPKGYFKSVTIFATIIIISLKYILEALMPAINRWAYFINEYGALTYLTGGSKRWEMTSSIFERIADYPLLIIIGSGWSGFAEQNFVDLLEGFGLLGIIVFSIWIFWAINIYKQLHYKMDSFLISAVFFLIIAVAVLAGHIIQSAMLAPFIAILANINYLNKHEKNFSNNERLSF